MSEGRTATAGASGPGIASRFATVRGESMHYLEAGSGEPVVFIHGNPTSSFLWRNVIPWVAAGRRCIAVDLIGMGWSGKPAIEYRLRDHVAYVDGFLEALGLGEVTFVLHDWGVAIGLHYLARFPERVRGVALMEGHLHPIERWADLGAGEAIFRQVRSEDVGRKMVIGENFFVEVVLPSGVVRALTEEEMEAYRAPFRRAEDREPLWAWPLEIPIEGEPADVAELMVGYREALVRSTVPKLLFFARPGAVIGAAEVAWCREELTNLTVVDLGEGIHFLPEDHGEAIGRGVVGWLDSFG